MAIAVGTATTVAIDSSANVTQYLLTGTGTNTLETVVDALHSNADFSVTKTTTDNVRKYAITYTGSGNNPVLINCAATITDTRIGETHIILKTPTGSGSASSVYFQLFGGTSDTDARSILTLGAARGVFNTVVSKVIIDYEGNLPVASTVDIRPFDNRSAGSNRSNQRIFAFTGRSSGSLTIPSGTREPIIIIRGESSSNARRFDLDWLNNALTGSAPSMAVQLSYTGSQTNYARFTHIGSTSYNFRAGSWVFPNGTEAPELRPTLADTTDAKLGTLIGTYEFPSIFMLNTNGTVDRNDIFPIAESGGFHTLVRDYPYSEYGVVALTGRASNASGRQECLTFVDANATGLGTSGANTTVFSDKRRFNSANGNIWYMTSWDFLITLPDNTFPTRNYVVLNRSAAWITSANDQDLDFDDSDYSKGDPRLLWGEWDYMIYKVQTAVLTYNEAFAHWGFSPNRNSSNAGTARYANVYYTGSYSIYIGGRGRVATSQTLTPFNSGAPLQNQSINVTQFEVTGFVNSNVQPVQVGGVAGSTIRVHATTTLRTISFVGGCHQY